MKAVSSMKEIGQAQQEGFAFFFRHRNVNINLIDDELNSYIVFY